MSLLLLPSWLSASTFWALILTVSALVYTRALYVRKFKDPLSRLPLPPGPPSTPVIGHLMRLPTSHEWLTYAEWSKEYGDVMQLRVFTQSVIVLGSLSAARLLLDRQSAITSDRPHFTMLSDLMGWDWAVQFQGMGPKFMKYRRTVQGLLNPQSCRDYLPAIDYGSREFLRSLLNDPGHMNEHVVHHCGGVMMTVLYGENDGPVRDSYIKLADKALHGLVEAGNVGKFLVDFLPILKYVPEWFPGADFQRKARVWRQMARDMIEVPFGDVKKCHAEGTASTSVTKTLLQQQASAGDSDIDDELIMGAAGVMYVGGADTALSALNTFVLSMVLYPEYQKKAQEEIDNVVGPDRLPDFQDRSSLPYFECIFSEVLRWNGGVPLGVPHRVMEDCELNGYRITKGSFVLYNQWAILHDPEVYADPFEFRPDRFINKDGIETPLDPRAASFGFGRRVCPGRYFADSLLWMMMIRMISVFYLSKPLDKEGKVIEPSGEYLTGMVTHPAPFACTVVPRRDTSAQHL